MKPTWSGFKQRIGKKSNMEVNKNPLLRIVLSPFSGLYGLITKLRNTAFDRGISPHYQSEIPSILVGNLSVGGTGKTPMIEFLIEAFPQLKIAVISRGYGRKSKGLLKVNPQGSSEDYGDECLQIAQKYLVHVWVSEKRKLGIQAAEQAACQLILLDDAFQHRHVSGHRTLLLSRFDQPFFSDFLLPGGGLRESRLGAQRADFIIFTKCPPELTESQEEAYRARSAYYSKSQVLFSHLKYGSLKDQGGQPLEEGQSIILVTGIANPEPLEAHLQAHFTVAAVHRFKDHHDFKVAEIQNLIASAQRENRALVCTDKDRVKLLPLVGDQAIYTVPVRHHFSEEYQKLLINDLQGLIRP